MKTIKTNDTFERAAKNTRENVEDAIVVTIFLKIVWKHYFLPFLVFSTKYSFFIFFIIFNRDSSFYHFKVNINYQPLSRAKHNQSSITLQCLWICRSSHVQVYTLSIFNIFCIELNFFCFLFISVRFWSFPAFPNTIRHARILRRYYFVV